jgi:DNA-binding response OmpR family regulator
MTWAQYRRRACSFEGREVPLGPIAAEIVSTLVMHGGRDVALTELLEAVYPDPDLEPDWGVSCIHRIINKLRRLMPGSIATHGWHGYSIAPPRTDYREAA